MKNRTIFTGDNLPVRRGIDSDSIDLIYLDPPFNSKRDYSAPVGSIAAGAFFKDTWTLAGRSRGTVKPNTVNLSTRQRNPVTQEPTLVGPKSPFCTPKLTVLRLDLLTCVVFANLAPVTAIAVTGLLRMSGRWLRGHLSS